ncbi:hypothetical protein RBG11_004259 [Vibrio parahaemolyticus]|nr:hypothetical protein [Vibrio parahaemolyticus]
MPPSLQNKPESKPEHDWYFDIFNTLSGYRSWNEGVPDPISLSDTFALLNELGIQGRTYRMFVTKLLSRMDDAYISHFAEKRKQRLEALKNKK